MASVRESIVGGNGTDSSGGHVNADIGRIFVNADRCSPLTRNTSVVAGAAGGAAGEAHHSTLTSNTSTATAGAVAAGTDSSDEPVDVNVGDGFVGAAHYRPLMRDMSTAVPALVPAPAVAAAEAAAAAAARAAYAAAAARAHHSTLSSNTGTAAATRAAGAANEAHHSALTGNTRTAAMRESGTGAAPVAAGAAMATVGSVGPERVSGGRQDFKF